MAPLNSPIKVVDEVLTRRKETEWFIEGDFDAYVERIRKPYVWGGELELLMASHLLKVPNRFSSSCLSLSTQNGVDDGFGLPLRRSLVIGGQKSVGCCLLYTRRPTEGKGSNGVSGEESQDFCRLLQGRGYRTACYNWSYSVDLVGGYYDAGDNVKYGFPMAFTATMLSWSVIEFGGLMKSELCNAREAIRWATDYLLKATAQPDTIYVQP